MKKIEVLLKELDKNSWGYDLKLLDVSATIEDYLKALNDFQEEKVASCFGCSGCCWERAPLTAPDIFTYGNFLFGNQTTMHPIRRFLKEYGLVYAKEGVVDIILRRKSNSACVFLDEQRQCCSRHQLRPLVCQSYVCLPTSNRAALLREQIINAGENELIRLYFLEFADQQPTIDEGEGAVDWVSYVGRGFTNKIKFREILIRDVIDEGLFENLIK